MFWKFSSFEYVDLWKEMWHKGCLMRSFLYQVIVSTALIRLFRCRFHYDHSSWFLIRICHTKVDPNHERYKCQKDCTRSCPNGHKCRTGKLGKQNHKCHVQCPKCRIPTVVNLACGHQARLECSKILDCEYMATFLCKVTSRKY